MSLQAKRGSNDQQLLNAIQINQHNNSSCFIVIVFHLFKVVVGSNREKGFLEKVSLGQYTELWVMIYCVCSLCVHVSTYVYVYIYIFAFRTSVDSGICVTLHPLAAHSPLASDDLDIPPLFVLLDELRLIDFCDFFTPSC